MDVHIGPRRGGYVADVFHSQRRDNETQWQTGEVGPTRVGAAGTDAHMRM